MHGALFRNLNTGSIQRLNSEIVNTDTAKSDPNKIYHPNGTWSYKADVNKKYEGNPYFTGITEDTENKVTLDKSIPAERLVGNNPEYEKACSEQLGAPKWYRRKENLDDMYKGNPYYKPSPSQA